MTYALVEAHYQARPTYSASSNPPMSRPQQNDMRVSYTYGQPPTSCYSYGGKRNKNISKKYNLRIFRTWYFVSKISDLLREKIVLVIEKKLLKFEAEGREFAKFLRSLEQFIQTVKGQNNFW